MGETTIRKKKENHHIIFSEAGMRVGSEMRHQRVGNRSAMPVIAAFDPRLFAEKQIGARRRINKPWVERSIPAAPQDPPTPPRSVVLRSRCIKIDSFAANVGWTVHRFSNDVTQHASARAILAQLYERINEAQRLHP